MNRVGALHRCVITDHFNAYGKWPINPNLCSLHIEHEIPKTGSAGKTKSLSHVSRMHQQHLNGREGLDQHAAIHSILLLFDLGSGPAIAHTPTMMISD